MAPEVEWYLMPFSGNESKNSMHGATAGGSDANSSLTGEDVGGSFLTGADNGSSSLTGVDRGPLFSTGADLSGSSLTRKEARPGGKCAASSVWLQPWDGAPHDPGFPPVGRRGSGSCGVDNGTTKPSSGVASPDGKERGAPGKVADGATAWMSNGPGTVAAPMASRAGMAEPSSPAAPGVASLPGTPPIVSGGACGRGLGGECGTEFRLASSGCGGGSDGGSCDRRGAGCGRWGEGCPVVLATTRPGWQMTASDQWPPSRASWT
eukprot:scaffold23264_cov84-Isochrysis_galbana.AAC.1